MPPGRLLALLGCFLALLAPAARASPRNSGTAVPAASASAVARAARGGGRLTITGLTLEGEAAPSSLELQPLTVWNEDARIVVHGADGPVEQGPPNTRVLRGTIVGKPQSTVMLLVGDNGIGGIANDGTNVWALGTDSPTGPAAAAAAGADGGLASYRARPAASAAAAANSSPGGRRCGNHAGSGVPNGRSLLHVHNEAHGQELPHLPHLPSALHSIPPASRKLAQVGGAPRES